MKDEREKMAEIIKLKDFLKPSYEAIEKEQKERDGAKKTGALYAILESDGGEVTKGVIDFLASSFVDIADGATCCEYENEFENLEIYINIKRKAE